MTAREGSSGVRSKPVVAELRARIESRLAELTPGAAAPARLADAMRYALLAPGKRVRAVLALLSADHCGGEAGVAMSGACALEMIHAASLILDDLPAMDDATLRRGRAACHKVYGEATSVLAAIALMNRAYAVVVEDRALPPDRAARMVAALTRSVGTDGLTGGQEADLNGCDLTGIAGVDWIHARKTAALFAAAAEIGAIASGATDAAQVTSMHGFGMQLGLAFQAYDDLLDATASAAVIGKDTGRDGEKRTAVAMLGLDAALQRADAQLNAALASLAAPHGALGAYIADLSAQLREPLPMSRAGRIGAHGHDAEHGVPDATE